MRVRMRMRIRMRPAMLDGLDGLISLVSPA